MNRPASVAALSVAAFIVIACASQAVPIEPAAPASGLRPTTPPSSGPSSTPATVMAPSTPPLLDVSAAMKTLGAAGRIVFYRTDDAREHNTASMIDPDGSNEIAVNADVPLGIWSPDRRRLAFAVPGALAGKWMLPAVVNADGSALALRERHPTVYGTDLYPVAWSSDVEDSLIVGTAGGNEHGLYTLTPRAVLPGVGWSPLFVPDVPDDAGGAFSVFDGGHLILFNTIVPQSDGPDRNTLFFVDNRPGSMHPPRRLSPNDPNLSVVDLEFFDGSSQDLSPDGAIAAFCVHFLATHQTGLFVADVRASHSSIDPVEIVPPALSAISVRFSPDGTRIAFTSEVGSDNQIWVVAPDGRGLEQLTKGDDGSVSIVPIWSPDGAKLLFERKRAGKVTLWTMNADGSDQRQLTTAPVASDWVGPYTWWAGPTS